jgi:hypothetical protein
LRESRSGLSVHGACEKRRFYLAFRECKRRDAAGFISRSHKHIISSSFDSQKPIASHDRLHREQTEFPGDSKLSVA